MTKDELKRFMQYVERYSPEDCWLWIGCANERGYGWFHAASSSEKNTHRLIWEHVHGPIAEGQSILHKCDISGCVNPSHLFIGTQSDNMIDAVRKGHRPTKLSVEQVVEIKKLLSQGLKHRVIAEKFGVSRGTVSLIHQGRNWTHVNQPSQILGEFT